ncbi:MAG: BrnT family toxin [Deltaproteobacteria bacterium]|nr:BrnT family toxin [Deltaproteobacteria bacterium]
MFNPPSRPQSTIWPTPCTRSGPRPPGRPRLTSVYDKDEKRFYCLGITDAGRKLFVVFTIRGHLIRVISARDMTPRERNTYEKLKEEDPSLQK